MLHFTCPVCAELSYAELSAAGRGGGDGLRRQRGGQRPLGVRQSGLPGQGGALHDGPGRRLWAGKYVTPELCPVGTNVLCACWKIPVNRAVWHQPKPETSLCPGASLNFSVINRLNNTQKINFNAGTLLINTDSIEKKKKIDTLYLSVLSYFRHFVNSSKKFRK